MSTLFTKAFWEATTERAVRSFAASLLALITADGTDVIAAGDFLDKCGVAGMAAIVTVLICVGSSGFGAAGPAIGNSEVLSPPAPKIGE